MQVSINNPLSLLPSSSEFSTPNRKRAFSETKVCTAASTPVAAENNIVTSAGTPSISGTSDDRDSSVGDGNGMAEATVEGTSGGTTSSGHDSGSTSNASGENGHVRTARLREDVAKEAAIPHIHHHHQHHSYQYPHHEKTSSNNIDDGSILQVPEDDGSERLAADSTTGIVRPAAVVASRYNSTHSSSTSSGSGGEGESQTLQHLQHLLLPPHREPGYHTIRKTLSRFPSSRKRAQVKFKRMRRSAGHKSAYTITDSNSSMGQASKHLKTRKLHTKSNVTKKILESQHKKRNRALSPSPDSSVQEHNGSGSSSGSGTEGTEGGYFGSASSNETGRPQASCSSPSVSSSEESKILARHRSRLLRSNLNEGASSSSEIADFGSSSSETAYDDVVRTDDFDFNSPSPPLSSSNDEAPDDLEESYLSARRAADEEHERMLQHITRKRKFAKMETSYSSVNKTSVFESTPTSKRLTMKNVNGRPPILTVGSDIMAHILTFLHPPEILDVLTTPLSKTWQRNFTQSPELWRVLCLVEPFKANMDDESSSEVSSNNEGSTSDSGESFCSMDKEDSFRKSSLDKYRSLYTAFVRCMKYLSQIREDAMSGRPPAYIDYGYKRGASSSAAVRRITSSSSPPAIHATKNKHLQNFFAEARGFVMRSGENRGDTAEIESQNIPVLSSAAKVLSISKKRRRTGKEKEKTGLKFGTSMITGRLLGPTSTGEAGNMNLPWSCAIYSIVNWMTAYSEVEGIQTLCLKVLPCILEDEQQRQTAQTARLTDVVLRAMVMFPESEKLHIAAFHTIVLLARPHGGREGMLFHSSMLATGIFGVISQQGKSGIAVMLDSMRRFQDSPVLSAMSCWALVNIALASEQKVALVKLGGIQATINAMSRHPLSAEVNFRALFALINLVIPSVNLEETREEGVANADEEHVIRPAAAAADSNAQLNRIPQEESDEISASGEREIINELVGEVTSLVVLAMRNFCSSEAILNRACLVLHNLSLTDDYHTTLLWTPQCYQMLEWCVTNYRTDQVLQQSATGTLHRLRLTLSQNEDIRVRFRESLRTQQHIAMEQAQKEALRLNEQQQALLANARQAAAAP